MDASEPRGRLALRAHRLLESLGAPALAPFLAEWPSPAALPPHAAPRAMAPSALPVLRCLPRMAGGEDSADRALVDALCEAAPLLAWRQTYANDEVDAAFLENYAWSEILEPTGRTRERISCGVILLGPNTFYPHHRHEAEEIYLPLCGTAHWQQGDGLWRQRAPGVLIHHQSEEPHAMRTGEQPLLALYLWRSADLRQKARLNRRRAG